MNGKVPSERNVTHYSLQCRRNDATVHWDVGTADTRLIQEGNYVRNIV